MDRGGRQATVHGVAKSLDTLSDFHFHSVSTLSSQLQLPEHWQHFLFLSFFLFYFFFFFCPPEHSDILQTKIPMEKCCFFLPRIILFTLVL